MLTKVKNAMRLTATVYDSELQSLIDAALADLGISDIDHTLLKESSAKADALLTRAVITYCRMNFGSPADYDKLVASYKLQKSQLNMATGYGFTDSFEGDKL